MKSIFDMKRITGEILKELDYRIDEYIESRSRGKVKFHKEDFFNEVRNGKRDFPVKKDLYYKFYNTVKKKKATKIVKNMYLETFYDICKYTDVSADYYLGFIQTKRKEASAPAVKREFGLSDESMDILSQIRKRGGEEKGGLSSDLMNYIFEDKVFWNELNEKLPPYIAALVYSLDDINTDAARYGVMKVFERLLDRISERCINSDLPTAKIDQAAPFQFSIV